jgi:hypothetical protein
LSLFFFTCEFNSELDVGKKKTIILFFLEKLFYVKTALEVLMLLLAVTWPGLSWFWFLIIVKETLAQRLNLFKGLISYRSHLSFIS